MTSNAARTRELNDTIRYTMWSVFRLETPLGDADRSLEADEVEKLLAELAGEDVKVRGVYDVSGLRADADVMVCGTPRTSSSCSSPTTGCAAPRSAAGSPRSGARPRCTARPSSTAATCPRSSPTRWRGATSACTSFVRSYEWYLLEDVERRRLLAEHGMMARTTPTSGPTRSRPRAGRLRVDAGVRGR